MGRKDDIFFCCYKMVASVKHIGNGISVNILRIELYNSERPFQLESATALSN